MAPSQRHGWPWWLIVPLGAAPLVMAVAVRYEARLARRGGQPVLDLSLFDARSFSAGIRSASVSSSSRSRTSRKRW